MKTKKPMREARAEMERIVDTLAITSDAKEALKEFYEAINDDRELGHDYLPSVYRISGVLHFLYRAQLIDDSEYEDLLMASNEYEAAEVNSPWN